MMVRNEHTHLNHTSTDGAVLAGWATLGWKGKLVFPFRQLDLNFVGTRYSDDHLHTGKREMYLVEFVAAINRPLLATKTTLQ